LEIFFVAGEQNSDFFIQNAAMVWPKFQYIGE
jgi:hypothetical protein